MDIPLQTEAEQAEDRVRRMVDEQTMPAAVVGYDVEFGVEFGEYADGGDPAVWINLHVPRNTVPDPDTIEALADLMSTLHLKLKHVVPDRFTGIRIHRPPGETLLAGRLAHA